ncbi:MAG TPA: diguanylate cyclase [Nitrospirae bacterium]|nr:response regulator PleD [bacterium BMS3Abin10]GBE37941.1 response regulator PleD [bacterium BMS3Bbin08]HDH50211.1 diguanylate cyclase [Nitrospirota bacterium]HDK41377.1 diguanylate cyclase [Nitrospirota bacterium]HDK80962.1 diguanylate cyclase [Nitrospirota bacterium]
MSSLDIRGKACHLSVSIGVAVFPDDSLDKDGLIKAADDALYMAKKTGRNRVVTFKQYKEEVAK